MLEKRRISRCVSGAIGGTLTGLLVALLVFSGCSGSKLDCDSLSSSGWQEAHSQFNRSSSDESGEKALDYAEAIERCGILEEMTRTEALTWMGKPDHETGKHTAVWDVSQDEFFDLQSIEVNWENGKVLVTVRQ